MPFVATLIVVAVLALLGCVDSAPNGDWEFKSPDCPGAYPNCWNAPTQF